MNDLFTLTSSVLEGSVRVVGFRGVEAISRPYEIEILFTLTGPESDTFDMADAVGARALLSVDRGDPRVPPFLLAGLFGSVELLGEVGDRALFRAVLVPRLQQLALSRHSRNFSRKSLPEILSAVLQDNGFSPDDYEMRLGSYETEEHVCQYRESDLDFLSRWMEREGIRYHFEHTEYGERVIFSDSLVHEPEALGTKVRYHPQSGQDRSAGACLRSFTCRHATLPAAVKLRDYDYTRPNLDVSGAASVSASGGGEVSLYGERFFTPGAGERLARLRAEEMLARQVVVHAQGDRLHLRSGRTFELEDHPRAALNKRYLVVEIAHHGNQSQSTDLGGRWTPEHDEVYSADIVAIPAATPFRPESRTPWPRIYGYENGAVDGPADSEYAQIDEHGRYKVKFRYDESHLKGGAASTFVRMVQPHGGAVEGFHFPLRKGTEVVVSFLGGDPDRPVISGVVPNALTPSPVLAGNHTTNVIQTGARNRIELEDRAGSERITVSTPHKSTYLKMGAPAAAPPTKGTWRPSEPPEDNLVLHTDGMGVIDVDASLHLHVGQDGEGSFIGHVQKHWETTVWTGHHQLDVVEGRSKTTVKRDVDLTVTHGDLSTTVEKGTMTTTVQGDTSTSVVAGSMTTGVSGDWTGTMGGYYKLVVGEPPVTKKKAGGPQGREMGPSPGSIVIESKTGDVIRIDADVGEIHIHAKSDVHIESATGKVAIDAKTGIDLTSEGKIKIEGKENKLETFLFDTENYALSRSYNLTIGEALDIFAGLQVNVFGGMSIDLCKGIALSVADSASISLNAGLSLAASGISVNLAVIEYSDRAIELDRGQVKAALEALHILG